MYIHVYEWCTNLGYFAIFADDTNNKIFVCGDSPKQAYESDNSDYYYNNCYRYNFNIIFQFCKFNAFYLFNKIIIFSIIHIWHKIVI